MTGRTVVQLLTSGDAGGGQQVSLKIGAGLSARGHGIRFVTPRSGPFTRLCAEVGEVDIVPFNSLRDIPHVRAIATYLRTVNATVLHTHTPIASALLWRVGARLAGVPVVHHVHTANFYGPRGLKSWAARALDVATIGSVRSVIAVSDATRAQLLALGYPGEKVRTVYNAIPFEKRPRVESGSGPEITIGCVGRLSVMKGQMELLESFPEIRAQFPRSRLWFVGTADASEHAYESALSSRAAELGISASVTFWGHRDDIEQIIRGLTMLVLPSKHEAFPLVLLEAMSSGVPVIATDVGGVTELVNHMKTGIIVPVDDRKAMLRAVTELAGSPDLRDRLSEAAYDFVWARFGPESTTKTAVSIVEEWATR